MKKSLFNNVPPVVIYSLKCHRTSNTGCAIYITGVFSKTEMEGKLHQIENLRWAIKEQECGMDQLKKQVKELHKQLDWWPIRILLKLKEGLGCRLL